MWVGFKGNVMIIGLLVHSNKKGKGKQEREREMGMSRKGERVGGCGGEARKIKKEIVCLTFLILH